MPRWGNGAKPLFLIARLEHEPAIHPGIGGAQSDFVPQPPLVRVAWRGPALAKASPFHRLRDHFPDLPGNVVTVEIFSMRTVKPKMPQRDI